MAKFKCIVSGNVIEFTNQVDIDSMVGHEGYIKLEEPQEAPKAPAVKKTATKTAPQVEAE
jgi:hypothetical protein